MAKTLKDYNESYIRSWKAYWKRKERIDEEIKALQKKQDGLRSMTLIKAFYPLFEEVRKSLNAKHFIHYGTFGMYSESPIYWLKENGDEITKKGNVLGSLCLISSGDGYAIRNHNKVVNNYGEGTIAEINGANYETIEITEKMDIDWLVKFVKRGK